MTYEILSNICVYSSHEIISNIPVYAVNGQSGDSVTHSLL